jgi:oxygen-independent coproporphyrinogen-3 oxidase
MSDSPRIVHAEIDEAKELAIYHAKPALANRDLGFVYFGGGTPSILSEIQIHKLITKLKALFPWTAVQEATFECAPKSVTEPKLRALREAGITRISMGVQQRDDAILKQKRPRLSRQRCRTGVCHHPAVWF